MSLRDIEAKLAANVADNVLQRLGYREIAVRLPGGVEVTPRPATKELPYSTQTRVLPEQILVSLGSPNRPATVVEVAIPKTHPEAAIRAEGAWQLLWDRGEPTVHDGGGTGASWVDCYPLGIQSTPARWIVVVTPQRKIGAYGNG